MERILYNFRRLVVVSVHVSLVIACNYLAFLLLLQGTFPPVYWRIFCQVLPWVVAIRMTVFALMNVNQGLWRYTGIWDLRNIVLADVLSSVVLFPVVRFGLHIRYPTSVYIIDTLLLICSMSGIRLVRRLYQGLERFSERKSMLIVGAGDCGAMYAKELAEKPHHGYWPIGFVDDDARKLHRRIHGGPVLGAIKDLPTIMAAHKPSSVLLAISRLSPAKVREIIDLLEPFEAVIKTGPGVTELLGKNHSVTQMRDLRLDDLLDRMSVNLDAGPLRSMLAGKRVLVTGAGGSIGSELCKQVANFNSKTLILLERYENGLHAIESELRTLNVNTRIAALIGDIADERRIEQVFREFAPEIVFHAAAHKHVPMMERNICEAVKNNVRGTRVVVEAATRHRAEKFILISTDKAVNPTSVMGATKRVAEIIVSTMNGKHATHYNTVRFGNVLGSNGSVIPMFVEQIKRGGPVTVTHPEMRRYFILISEAVQLVLQAAAMRHSSAAYILEMGEQLNVIDVARKLIRLAGLRVGADVEIRITGIRPGEKLFEELVGPDETIGPSTFPNVLELRSDGSLFPRDLPSLLCNIEAAALHGDEAQTRRLLHELLPNYREPENAPATGLGATTGPELGTCEVG
jgi:FlaA1/EpsC-like NDP-sugar epimerase